MLQRKNKENSLMPGKENQRKPSIFRSVELLAETSRRGPTCESHLITDITSDQESLKKTSSFAEHSPVIESYDKSLIRRRPLISIQNTSPFLSSPTSSFPQLFHPNICLPYSSLGKSTFHSQWQANNPVPNFFNPTGFNNSSLLVKVTLLSAKFNCLTLISSSKMLKFQTPPRTLETVNSGKGIKNPLFKKSPIRLLQENQDLGRFRNILHNSIRIILYAFFKLFKA